MDTHHIDSVISRYPPRAKHLKKCVHTLNEMAIRCGFTDVVMLQNLDMLWIEPTTGYVAKFPKNAKFKAEPFLARMFCGLSILTLSKNSNLDKSAVFKRASMILRGTIHDRSPRPFDPLKRNSPWIPSLGDRSSYIGVFTGKLSQDSQNSIICNAGLDYSVECALQKYFVEQQEAGKTYGEVFKSDFVESITWYSVENRKRLIHTLLHVIDLTQNPMPTEITLSIDFDPKYKLDLKDDKAKYAGGVVRVLYMYCTKNQHNKISPYFIIPVDRDIEEEFHNYPLGPVLNDIEKKDSAMYTAITKKISNEINATIEIITTDTVQNSKSSYTVEADIPYNYVSTIGTDCIYFSECTSTVESKGKSFTDHKPILGPTIYMSGTNDIRKTTTWISRSLGAFPTKTPDTGLETSRSYHGISYNKKFISNIKLSTNTQYNCNRAIIDQTSVADIGFNSNVENTVICTTPTIIRLSN